MRAAGFRWELSSRSVWLLWRRMGPTPVSGPASREAVFFGPMLECCDRREEAAPGPVGAVASPILPVGTRQRLVVGHRLVGHRQLEPLIAGLDREGGHHKTVTGAAAPFAILRTAEPTPRNPAVMRISYRGESE